MDSNVTKDDFVSKIKNIDGKIVQDGKLRKALRNVNMAAPGTFVAPLDYSSMSSMDKTQADDVFVGVTSGNANEANDNETNGTKQSYASMFKQPTAPKAVQLTTGHSLETVDVEYEWQPPHCETCKIFDHKDVDCLKREKVVVPNQEVNQDGFTQVTRKNGKGKQDRRVRRIACIKLTKPKPNIQYRVVRNMNSNKRTNKDKLPTPMVIASTSNSHDKGETTGVQRTSNINSSKQPSRPNDNLVDNIDLVSLRNTFESLKENDKILDMNDDLPPDTALEDDEEEVEDIYVEQPFTSRNSSTNGASTPIEVDNDIFALKFLSIGIALLMVQSWCIMGDFNVSLHMDDNSTSTSTIDTCMRDFQACVEEIEVSDVNSMGLKFTWNQKPHGVDGPYRISDHAPAVLRFPMLSTTKPCPFKFCNIMVHNVRFKDIVAHGWQEEISEERFLMQKAKVKWLKFGDDNTAYFHKVVKSQASRYRINTVTTSNGDCVNRDHVPMTFIDYYTEFLDQQGVTFDFNSSDLFHNQISSNIATHMVRDVFNQEIRDAIFCMADNKASGPDGYSVAFFKEARRISDNSLLTQELMHNYHLDRSTLRCAFTVDIQKAINGSLHGYFKGKRGLHQGDPMSPYLFTLVMEVLTFMLHRRARESNFTYHRYCSKLNIINLCCADDLFIFAHGDVESARVIMNTLEEFKNASGLTPSLPKSTAYFWVPLVPSRLLYRDCMELMEKVKRRINDWKNKSLSLAGRAQLIRSVLGEMRWGKAKVAWEDVCLPRKEGGLGIPRLVMFNKVLISTHIWSLLIRKVRNLVRPFIWSRVGNGATISAWFDNWCTSSPLAEFISNRNIYRAGLHLSAKVSEIIEEGTWCWPPDWISKYPNLANVIVLNIFVARDSLVWRHITHGDVDFLVAKAWDCIWPRANKVWNHLKSFISIPNIPYDLNSIVDFLIPLANMRSTRSVVSKLVFAATSYFIWEERNNRLFMKTSRTKDQIINIIMSIVRLKLLTCKFKKTKNVEKIIHL
nr:hypothetical protein [Tanacetum cinerariifolium]